MGKRINIGIYIGSEDTDIAAWFNLLQENHMSRSKWSQGLFVAYAMQKSLPIGAVNPYSPLVRNDPPEKGRGEGPLFGFGSSQAEILKRDRYGYGWQIRGPHREFIYGSVINISISKAEILPIIEETWQNGHRLATFLKALIRKNLNYASQPIAPRLEDLHKILSDYIVLQNRLRLTDVNPAVIRQLAANPPSHKSRTVTKTRKPAGAEYSANNGLAKRNTHNEDSSAYEDADTPKKETDTPAQHIRNPLLSEI